MGMLFLSHSLIENGEVWMQMIKSRNLSSHTYDETRADDIVEVIKSSYFNEFNLFLNKMTELEREE
nr:nucleotidyltransferase substrate binding protein [Haliovirga abyssi]